MKIAFRKNVGLNKKNIVRLSQINVIIEEYREQGYKLTLRQLYYQLVSRDIIPNNVREYDKIGNILTKGRMAGIVDWDSIEDRVRTPRLPYQVEDQQDAMKDTVNHYRLDRQKNQVNYIELWVEKDALSNVLSVKTRHYHVRLMVNRGYSSCTAMYDAFNRIAWAFQEGKETVTIYYLGDFDPSGLDMCRDIKDRLTEFLVNSDAFIHNMGFSGTEECTEFVETHFELKPIGLTAEQIKLYNPPPNPAKMSDPRAAWYVEKYGNTSWEVDALNPDILHSIIDENIKDMIDEEKFQEVIEQEDSDKKELSKLFELKEGSKKFKKLLKSQLAKSKTKKEKDLVVLLLKEANKIM